MRLVAESMVVTLAPLAFGSSLEAMVRRIVFAIAGAMIPAVSLAQDQPRSAKISQDTDG